MNSLTTRNSWRRSTDLATMRWCHNNKKWLLIINYDNYGNYNYQSDYIKCIKLSTQNYHNCQLRFPLPNPYWNCHKYLHCRHHYHNHCHCHRNVTQVIEQIYKYIPEARQGKAHLDHVSICHQHHLLHQHLPHDHKHHDHLILTRSSSSMMQLP